MGFFNTNTVFAGLIASNIFISAKPMALTNVESACEKIDSGELQLPTLRVLPYPQVRNFFESDEGYGGEIYEKVNDFLNHSNVDYVIELMPWNRILREAKEDHNSLIVSLVRNVEREYQYNWVLKIRSVDMELIGRSSEDYSGLNKEDFIGGDYSVVCDDGAVQCDLLVEYGFQEKNIVRVKGMNHLQKVQFVERGRVDFMVAEYSDLKAEIIKAEFPDNTLKPVAVVKHIDSYLAVGKNINSCIYERLTNGAASYSDVDDF